MKRLIIDSISSYYKRFFVLHTVFLVGYTILIFGSWALFFIGGIFLLPIFRGLVDIALASTRQYEIGIKDLFTYFRRSHKGPAIAHTLVTANIHLVLLSTFLILYQVFEALIPSSISDNSYVMTGVILISALPYIMIGTYFSLASYISVDNHADTLDALKGSILITKENIIKYSVFRLMFFFRNGLFFGVLAMRWAYHFNYSDTPNQLSGQPVMIMMFLWVGLLILTSPFYETMRAHMYLSSIED